MTTVSSTSSAAASQTAMRGYAARLREWLAAPTPSVAVEFSAGRVVVAPRQERVQFSPDRAVVRNLPGGTVTPSATLVNLTDAASLSTQLRSMLEAAGATGAEVTLLVPDLTARISVLDFDTLPARSEELDSLVRFRLRKSLPFSDERAAVSCQALPSLPGDTAAAQLLVVVADRERLDEYENCLEAAGARVGLLLPSGLACLAAHPALDDGTLLVRADRGSMTTAFCDRGRVAFYRVIEIDAEAAFDDIFPSIAYFRDRWEARSGNDGPRAAILTAGLMPELSESLRNGVPWADIRAIELSALGIGPDRSAELLAVSGALLGRFS